MQFRHQKYTVNGAEQGLERRQGKEGAVTRDQDEPQTAA